MIPAKSLHPLLSRKILLLIVVGMKYFLLSPHLTIVTPAGLVLSIISTVISFTMLVLGLSSAGPDKLLQEMGGRLEDLGPIAAPTTWEKLRTLSITEVEHDLILEPEKVDLPRPPAPAHHRSSPSPCSELPDPGPCKGNVARWWAALLNISGEN